jgi:6-phosphogluconolactonase
LVLLGMGPDGHTASLFPGTSALTETTRWVAATWVPRLQTWRITLTFPAINAARHVLFAVTGAGTADRLALVFGLSPGGNDLPAARIRTNGGGVTWLIDREASGGRTF